MKKILLILILIFPFFIDAKEYYGEYKYIETKDYFVEETDLIKVNSIYKYKYYYEYEDGEFLTEDIEQKYAHQDLANIKYGEYGEWQDNYHESDQDLYEHRSIYGVRLLKPVRYIHFYNLQGSNGGFRIPELDIMYNNQEINFTYYCEGCSTYFAEGINNQKANENLSVIYDGGYLRLDLGNYYDLHKLEVNMYLYDTSYNGKSYSIAFSREPQLSKHYFSQSWVDFFKNKDFDDLILRKITPFGMISNFPEYEQENIVENQVTNRGFDYIKQYNQYRYRNKYYFFYNINRVYSDDYLDNPSEPYINISDQFINLYEIYERPYLYIEDISMLNKGETLKDKIITNAEYTVEDNTNYEINGEYISNIYFEDQVIEIKTVINYIEENIIEEKVEEQNKIETKKNIKPQNNTNIKETIKEKPSFDEKSEEEIIIELQKPITTEQQVIKEEVVKTSSIDYKNFILILIFIIFMIIRKKQKANNI